MYPLIIFALLLYHVLILPISLIQALLCSCKERISLAGVSTGWQTGQHSPRHNMLDIIELYIGCFHCCQHLAEGIEVDEPICLHSSVYSYLFNIESVTHCARHMCMSEIYEITFSNNHKRNQYLEFTFFILHGMEEDIVL
jgi:hypothetical protein